MPKENRYCSPASKAVPAAGGSADRKVRKASVTPVAAPAAPATVPKAAAPKAADTVAPSSTSALYVAKGVSAAPLALHALPFTGAKKPGA